MKDSRVRAFSICAIGAIGASVLSSALFVATGRTSEQRVDESLLARGRYLVKTTGCNDCHTPGYAANAGRVEESRWLIGNSLGWQGPWGTTYPPNLRLLVQGLTPGQWLATARRPMRPPMPWFALREMTDADLLAIYHFARALGPAGSAAPSYLPPGQTARTPVVSVPAG